MAYTGFPNAWTGPVSTSHRRAWGLITFGEEGVEVTVTSITFDRPIPDGLHADPEVNTGDPVPTGAERVPPGARLSPLPATVRGPAQMVVWLSADEAGLNYFSPDTVIDYSIGGHSYRTTYPVGVGACTVVTITGSTTCPEVG